MTNKNGRHVWQYIFNQITRLININFLEYFNSISINSLFSARNHFHTNLRKSVPPLTERVRLVSHVIIPHYRPHENYISRSNQTINLAPRHIPYTLAICVSHGQWRLEIYRLIINVFTLLRLTQLFFRNMLERGLFFFSARCRCNP